VIETVNATVQNPEVKSKLQAMKQQNSSNFKVVKTENNNKKINVSGKVSESESILLLCKAPGYLLPSIVVYVVAGILVINKIFFFIF
jgi:hypothetical protein